MTTYSWEQNYSRRRPIYGSRSAFNYKQRLVWEQESKACGFPLKLKETHMCGPSRNNFWWDGDWNTRSSLTRNWKCQRKVKKQWMRK